MPREITKRPMRQSRLSFIRSSSNPQSAKTHGKKVAPERVFTDVVLPIHSKWMNHISKREKNHEFRGYELRSTVERFWLYETSPTSAITHGMQTTRPKTPGHINDSSGIGNDDFDNDMKKSTYGYPVLGLWKLKTPITSKDMKEKFQMSVPQSYCFVYRAMIDQEPLEDMEKLF